MSEEASQVLEDERSSIALWLRALMLIAFTVGMVVMMARTLVITFDATRAVPPEEFPAAGVLKSVLPELVLTQTLAVIVFGLNSLYEAIRLFLPARGGTLWQRTQTHFWTALAWVVTATGFALTLIEPEVALVGGLGLYIVFVSEGATRILARKDKDDAGERRIVQMVGAIRWRHLVHAGPIFFLLPGIAFLLGVIGELYFYTSDFAGAFFPTEAFWRFALLASAGAMVAGARLGFEILLLVLLMRAVVGPRRKSVAVDLGVVAVLTSVAFSAYTLFSWEWVEMLSAVVLLVAIRIAWGWQDDGRRVLVLTLLPGLYVWGRTRDILLAAMHDEIAALDFIWMTYLLFGLLGTLVAVWAQIGLSAWLREHEITSPRNALEVIVLAVLCPVLPMFVKQGRAPTTTRRMAAMAAFLFLAGCLFLSVLLNYPAFTDYFQFMQKLFSMLIGYVIFGVLLIFLMHVLQRPMAPVRSGPWIAGGVLVAAIVIHMSLDGSQMLRFIGHHYSKVSRQAVEMGRIIPEAPHIRLRDQDKPDAEPLQLAREERFTPLPEATQTYYETRRPMIIFIIWDAARHDHMSAYGYERPTTPAAKALAAESVVFTQARSSATATSSSLRHIFSGRLSSRYMLETDHHPFFNGQLADAGYDYFLLNILGSDYNGVSSDAFLRNQGDRKLAPVTHQFSTYEEQAKNDAFFEELDVELSKRKDREHPGDGMFVFLHCATTHYPWQLWDDHQDYGTGFEDLYDNSIGHVDKALADMVAGLKARGLYEDSIIVLTADHGTGLNEHGIYGGFQTWEEQIRVPLIMKIPTVAPRIVDAPVTGLDLAPTLVHLFNAGEDNPFDGFSMMPLALGEKDDIARRYLFSQSAFEDAFAVIDLETNYKIHVHRTERYEMLYDLGEDPLERHNLADAEPEVVDEFLEWLRPFLWARRHEFGNPYHYSRHELD